jgi:alanyl aminopeptidase
MLARLSVLLVTILLISLTACQNNISQGTRVNSTPTQFSSIAPPDVNAVPLGRLGKQVIPQHYQLELTIVPEKDTFSGKTTIDLQVMSPTQVIWLHENQIHASSVIIRQAQQTITGHYQQVDKTGVVKIRLEQPIQPGMAVLEIAYTAGFNGALEGLYKVEEDGLNYIFSQFEATSARLAFPGFDEPDFKVPFNITLIIDPIHIAITNTPEVSTTTTAAGLKKSHTQPPSHYPRI